jgi:hypothetical protein
MTPEIHFVRAEASTTEWAVAETAAVIAASPG